MKTIDLTKMKESEVSLIKERIQNFTLIQSPYISAIKPGQITPKSLSYSQETYQFGIY